MKKKSLIINDTINRWTSFSLNKFPKFTFKNWWLKEKQYNFPELIKNNIDTLININNKLFINNNYKEIEKMIRLKLITYQKYLDNYLYIPAKDIYTTTILPENVYEPLLTKTKLLFLPNVYLDKKNLDYTDVRNKISYSSFIDDLILSYYFFSEDEHEHTTTYNTSNFITEKGLFTGDFSKELESKKSTIKKYTKLLNTFLSEYFFTFNAVIFFVKKSWVKHTDKDKNEPVEYLNHFFENKDGLTALYNLILELYFNNNIKYFPINYKKISYDKYIKNVMNNIKKNALIQHGIFPRFLPMSFIFFNKSINNIKSYNYLITSLLKIRQENNKFLHNIFKNIKNDFVCNNCQNKLHCLLNSKEYANISVTSNTFKYCNGQQLKNEKIIKK